MTLILILISLTAVTAITTWASINSSCYNFFGDFVCSVVAFCGFVGLFAYCFLAFSWTASGYEKDIINREYNTNYTQEEIFYASGVIDTIKELERKRIEINGDLITGK